ncbi:hypothetical protein BJ138DRAFT_1115844 [Hygrophoropsis aurantiaca]|uniref:Uncharacterized protein n=1 Tax=Hygrophoropsis aurantiaca TaxID=72124 RepID=A0ACB8A703_9AGAM|nr:hypothetical protein BJ138DRAFT_1115844 [Hygrophoropsis aurantiaca]
MDSSTPPPLAPVGTVAINIGPEFDGMYTGILLATVLSGITIVQGWIYLNNNRDTWLLRSLVLFLISADILTTSLDLRLMHRYLVENFGNLTELVVAPYEIITEYAVTVLIVFLVQLFFLSRVYMLRKEKWIVALVIAVFATAAVVTGFVAIADLAHHPRVAFLTSTANKVLFGINGSFSAVADIIITAALTWTFASSKKGIKRSDTILQKLLMYVVSRGLLVSVSQVLFLVTYLAKPDALWWVPLHFMLSKLYVITMVAMLNGRESIRSQANGVQTSTSMFTESAAGRNTQRLIVQKTIELSQFGEDDYLPQDINSEQRKGDKPTRPDHIVTDNGIN